MWRDNELGISSFQSVEGLSTSLTGPILNFIILAFQSVEGLSTSLTGPIEHFIILENQSDDRHVKFVDRTHTRTWSRTFYFFYKSF